MQSEHRLDERPREHDRVDHQDDARDLLETARVLDLRHFCGDHYEACCGGEQGQNQHCPLARVLACRDALNGSGGGIAQSKEQREQSEACPSVPCSDETRPSVHIGGKK